VAVSVEGAPAARVLAAALGAAADASAAVSLPVTV
jgi:hypothetical protein